MRPGWSTQLPNFNSHTTPGPLSRLTTAFNSSSVKRVSSPESRSCSASRNSLKRINTQPAPLSLMISSLSRLKSSGEESHGMSYLQTWHALIGDVVSCLVGDTQLLVNDGFTGAFG